MRYRFPLPLFMLVLALLTLAPLTASAQTATTTTVSGTVTDSTGAVIAGATVKLTDMATNAERVMTTNSDGQYSFYAVNPGLLRVTVNAKGFKTKVVTDVQASATTVATVNVTVEIGEVGEVVQVTAGVEAQLQTADATIGSVFDEARLKRLPNINRQANSLFSLQPATTPTGEFAGARNDQSTIMLDGVDISDNVLGQNFRTVIPVPLDSVEEFRGASANANATFGRSAGGQLTLVTKSGGNLWHGSAYLYHQDSALAANSWTLNRLAAPANKKPVFVDNRFGGTLGGPIFKDRTFFFLNYEGRRNPTSAVVTRIVPTDTYKQGIMRFRDASGAVQTIDAAMLKTLDPRSLGANPKALEYLALYPSPNDAGGDGLNTGGFTFAAPLKNNNDFGVARLDHKFTEKLNLNAKFAANRLIATNANQVDITKKQGTGVSPSRPRNAVIQATSVLKPNLTNVGFFSWTHDRLDFAITSPQTFAGLNVPINFGAATVDDLIDVDTQRARHQFRTLNIYQWSDTLSWVKGSHNVQAGGNIRRIRSVDFRDDKVVGSITTPVADVSTAGNFVTVAAGTQRPPFIQAADVARYNTLYAGLLGMVSQVPVLITRDSSLNLQPFGTGLFTQSTLKAWEFYASDTWRLRPSLTVTYGLTYNWQEPPVEDSGKQTVITFKDSGQLVDLRQYLLNKAAAASAGQIYNPDLAYVPLKQAGRNTAFNTDYKDFSPRFSVAWNPSFRNGLFGKSFGDRKTVVRGGYSLVYDRTNTVQTITIPTLGVGFAQTINIAGPTSAPGQPFRIGIDGPIPLPTATQTVPSPVVPIKPFGETLSFSVDPNIKVPRNHVVDFTIQRELPWRMLLEVGYIGRFARDLYVNANLNSVPFFHKDQLSGQTLAQAFDGVAGALRNNQTVAAQPYFENRLNGATFRIANRDVICGSVPGATISCTQGLASTQAANFINGNISTLQQIAIDAQIAFARGIGTPITNLQSQDLLVRTSAAISNYHALIVTLRKRYSQGLALDFNYTLGRSLDQSSIATQNNVGEFQTSFFPGYDYGPSLFDIRHLFNVNGTYELPFGKGRRFASGGGAINKVIGGWYTAGIFTYQSGLPLTFVQNAEAFGGSSIFGPNAGLIPLKNSIFDPGPHSGVNGSNGIGTNANPATPTRGSGLNLFANPEEVFNSFRNILLSQDTRHGNGALRGLGRWNLDWSVGKETNITEKVRFTLAADFINVFNHVTFGNPTLNFQNRASFGVLTAQFNQIGQATNGSFGPRRIQISGRFDF